MIGKGITLIGLGPGDPGLLTRQAWEILQAGGEILARTSHHPVLENLPPGTMLCSFDDLLAQEPFGAPAITRMADVVLEHARRPQGVCYAVPGHPGLGEASAAEIARRATLEGIPVQVIAGVSAIESGLAALDLPLQPELALVDALDLGGRLVPPFPPSQPALVLHLHGSALAGRVSRALQAHYPAQHPVRMVQASVVDSLALEQVESSLQVDSLAVLYVPPLGAETSFEAFQELIARLRAPDGCPWDRKQTHLSLRTYLLEETYEALDALDSGNLLKMQEEFGDLLLQIVLHAQIAAEAGEFTMADVLRTVHTKMVRRHPHVFGEQEIHDAEGVLVNWERLKAEERAANGKASASLLDGVALALPGLSQASEYLKRVARVGFDWPDIQAVIRKLDEELGEVHRAGDATERNYEIGDLLFAIANLARWYDVDPESALREANQRFRKRFAYIEQAAQNGGCQVSEMSLEELLALWQQAKQVA